MWEFRERQQFLVRCLTADRCTRSFECQKGKNENGFEHSGGDEWGICSRIEAEAEVLTLWFSNLLCLSRTAAGSWTPAGIPKGGGEK